MSTFQELQWKKFPVLDQGFVTLVDVMGDDTSVVQAARVSYGSGTKTVSDDRTLIRYLMRHGHTTPFEMAEVKLLVRVPMDCWRQWIRHRTASVNEYSTRYSEAIDAAQQVLANGWRLQSGNNKQGSAGVVDQFPGSWKTAVIKHYGTNEISEVEWRIDDRGDPMCEASTTPGEYLCDKQTLLLKLAREVYEERLKFGVAREQARKDLPLSTYTEAYWKCDLLNLLRFLSLRMDGHAQLEIRQFATIIGEQIVAPLFPLTWEAFNDYDVRRGAVVLTALEIKVMKSLHGFARAGRNEFLNAVTWADVGWPGLGEGKSREQEECWTKFVRIGLVSESGVV